MSYLGRKGRQGLEYARFQQCLDTLSNRSVYRYVGHVAEGDIVTW